MSEVGNVDHSTHCNSISARCNHGSKGNGLCCHAGAMQLICQPRRKDLQLGLLCVTMGEAKPEQSDRVAENSLERSSVEPTSGKWHNLTMHDMAPEMKAAMPTSSPRAPTVETKVQQRYLPACCPQVRRTEQQLMSTACLGVRMSYILCSSPKPSESLVPPKLPNRECAGTIVDGAGQWSYS